MKAYKFPRSRKLGWASLLGILLTLTLTYAEQGYTPSHSPVNKVSEQAEIQAVINRVVDGDTIDVKIDSQEYKVRMLGINTPETVDPRKQPECYGKEASLKTKSLLPPGTTVMLRADPTQDRVDMYNRLLRYVYREPDGLFVNEYLVREGYAHEYTYNHNPHLHQAEFRKDEAAAREEEKGLWARDACK